MRRTFALWLLASCACAALGCGKYGPPVRSAPKAAPPASEEAASEAPPAHEEATP